ncbi:phytanoyl-CoA dioxygenase family protein [Agarilytica rhodophyticola]|uniref:phytanoyl-CoA dioxygenase family protein n=1 Tax=Agarilytica rhodophyticola TaxID=1737490 RepID=UPI000B349A81|nr:phytanoyl-CoA dioxygenase family protein [Agarilytica rhodophyticola]
MTNNSNKSIDACANHYGENADAMRHYLTQGQERALALNNRGPITFDASGRLSRTICDAYSAYGFYIFENVLQSDELEDIKADLAQMRERFPASSELSVTANGEPALGAGYRAPNLIWSKPLGDPLGGTSIANGRHQVKLFEPEAALDAPNEAVFVILGSLQFSDACLRVYGHPRLLQVAAHINGEDFTPFHECLFIKDPGLGAAVSWHQDGDTHWQNPAFDEDIHGFNFMAQVYGSTAVNGVWVLPGTHKQGKIDIKNMVADAGSERLPGAIPIICNAGDVVICNRQLVHGSFANSGFEPRVTVNFGFHKRSSVLNVKGAGIHSEAVHYDNDMIRQRSRLIGYAIDARRQRFANETPYTYKPFAEQNQRYHWDAKAKLDIKDYNLQDLSI